MSAITVRDAILQTLQRNTAIETEFSMLLTGAVTSVDNLIEGTNTLFKSQLKVGDYIGVAAKGYRMITEIDSDTNLTVESEFESEFDGEVIRKTFVTDSFDNIVNTFDTGRLIAVEFFKSTDIDAEAAKSMGMSAPIQRVMALYGFTVIVAFSEIDRRTANHRTMAYDKLLRDAIDYDLTFNGTCIGITDMGDFSVDEYPNSEGIYFGALPVITYKMEQRGNR